jgi:histone acetyltransferase (RNA polymerase elongator complex component)
MKRRIIPIFVPHKGCPHDCIFCNQKKITGVSTDVTSTDVENTIREYLKTIDEDTHIEVAFFGGSFTAIDINIQKELLSVAKGYFEKGIINDIRLSTRPDCIDDEILTMLKEHKVTIIELGVQSLDETVLIDSIRGHSDTDVEYSANLIKKYGFKLGLQMMIGLPSDTEEKSLYTARKFINLSPDFVRIYPTLVVRDTGLEILLKNNKYKPLNIEQTIDLAKKLLVLFYINKINVIRVGLQPTEDIRLGKEVIEGPYHPALRELIESRMYRDYLETIINQNNVCENMIIKVNKKNISKIIGNKKSNNLYLKEKYNVTLKTLESDFSLDKLEIIIDDSKSILLTVDSIYKELFSMYNL